MTSDLKILWSSRSYELQTFLAWAFLYIYIVLFKKRNMAQKLIATDIDDVLFPFLREVNKYYNERYGTNFKIEDYKTPYLWKTWNIPLEKEQQIILDFYETESFSNMQPIQGAVESIRTLSNESPVIGISARRLSTQRLTEREIERFFPEIREVLCLGTYEQESKYYQIPKSVICLDKNVGLIFEDNLQQALSCAENGIQTVLFDYPTNQNGNKDVENLTRIYAPHWENFMRYRRFS